MKAYMSARQTERPELTADERGYLAHGAFLEARRILAETEADVDCERLATLASDRARDLAYDERSDAGDVVQALAAALAAFVADEERS